MTQPPDPFAPPTGPQPVPPAPQDSWAPAPASPWGGQPQGQWPAHWPAQPPWGAPTKTNVCAILSLVFAFLCFPAGLVLGIVALVQLKSSQDGGRGLAIAGVVVSALWVPLIALVVVVARSGAFDDLGVSTGNVSEATTTTVGECMQSSNDDQPNAVVPCSSAHDQEVYFVGPLGSGEYPGDDEVYQRADSTCHREFAAYVGSSYFDSDYGYDFYWPDATEWTTAEERRVVCVVTPLFKTSTGSAHHANH